jgi:hypothetical protein
MKLRVIFQFIFLVVLVNYSFAQPQLALLKGDNVITRFEEGEYIRFQRKGDEGFIRAIIIGIHPGYFIVGEDTIYTYDVAKIDLRKKGVTNFKLASLGKGLMTAGVGLFIIDLFNTTVIRDKSYEIDNSITSASLVLVGVGALMQVVNNNYFKIGRNKKVATLNLR